MRTRKVDPEDDRLARMETMVYVIMRDVRVLRVAVDGNGRPGLKERVAATEATLKVHKKAGGLVAAALSVLVAILPVLF
jgi:hypothetical protein